MCWGDVPAAVKCGITDMRAGGLDTADTLRTGFTYCGEIGSEKEKPLPAAGCLAKDEDAAEDEGGVHTVYAAAVTVMVASINMDQLP